MASTTLENCSACCIPCVDTGCCGNCIPGLLYAVFGSPLDDLGTVTCTYNSVSGAWEATATTANCSGAGSVIFSFVCDPPDHFSVSITINGSFSNSSITIASCDPFELSSSIPIAGCDPFATVLMTVTETPL